MTSGLNIGTTEDGQPFELPQDVLTHTIAILAKKGAGKTYTAGVIEEEFAERGMPFIVLDPVGVHYGLRSNADGKRSGYPIVVFGGEHGDVPIERDMGAAVALAVVEENISCIVDLSELSKTAWRQFTRDFCRELYRRNRNTCARHVFIEEATEFVPQTRRPEMQEVYESVERLVRMGRNRGLGVTLISQRSAAVAKDVLTQLDTLIALRTVGPQDRKALLDMFEGVLEEDDWPRLQEFKTRIPRLPDGTAFVWSPEKLKCFTTIRVRERRTFHGGATAQVGEVQLIQAKPDVTALRARLAKPEELEEEQSGPATKGGPGWQELVELRNKVSDLEGELKKTTEHNERLAAEVRAGKVDAESFRKIKQLLGSNGTGGAVGHVDQEAIVQEVLARIPVGGGNGVAQVAPPEALRKKYLQQASDRLMDKIGSLTPDALTLIEYLIGQDRYCPVSQISRALSGSQGGGTDQRWKQAAGDLRKAGLLLEGGHGMKSGVRNGVERELQPHGAEEDEVSAVESQVLARLTAAGATA